MVGMGERIGPKIAAHFGRAGPQGGKQT